MISFSSKTTLLVSTFIAVAVSMASCSKDADSLFNDTADLVFTNGNIYTVNTDTPWVQSVGIKDGRIVALGSDAETAKWVGPQTKTVNLHGKLAMPSFGDAHVHPIFGGLSFAQCSLHNGRSVDAYIAIIKKCLAETPGDDLLFGRGWGPGYFPPDGVPHKNILDALAPDRPVVIQSTGGHSYWVNSKALALANITKDTPDPAKGRIDRDPVTGEAVGGLQETAKDIIQPFIPAPTDVEMQNAILYTVKLFNSLGITNWYDAGIDDIKPDGESATLDAYTEVKAQGKLTTHVSIALKWDNDKSLDQIPTLYAVAKRAGAAGFSANGIKLYTDGVIVQRTAAVLEPYVDTKDDLGELSIPVQELNDIVTKLDHDGFQVYVHSIGDRAVHETLNAFERARSVNGSNDNRHFIAHLNLVAPADQPRFSTLNVAANFQPLWASDDPYMRLTAERLGPERMQYIYPANSILQAGGRLVYGADWSVASADPLLGIEVALTRKPTDRPEAKALLAHEGVTLAQAIKAYTLDVAFITHREDETGSLEIGKSADLIVIDQNLFIIPVNDISDSKVILTLFKGQTVYGSLSGL